MHALIAAALSAAMLAAAPEPESLPVPPPPPAEPATTSETPAPAAEPAPSEPAPPAPAGDAEPAVQGAAPVSEPAPPPADDAAPVVSGEPDDPHVLDRLHGAVVHGMLQTVLRLDRFFSDDRVVEQARADTFVKFRNEVRWDDDVGLAYRPLISADIRLPGLEGWLQGLWLSLSGGRTATQISAGRESFSARDETDDGVALQLRYRIFESRRLGLGLGAGLLFEPKPVPFAAARFRWTQPLGGDWAFRFGQTLFVGRGEGAGETTDAVLDWALTPSTLFETGIGGTLSTEREHLDWAAQAGLRQRLGPSDAVFLVASTTGIARPQVDLVEHRVAVRYRHRLFRDWVFAELEPELRWPLQPNEPVRIYGVITRLELQFGGRRRLERRAGPAPQITAATPGP